MCIIDSSIGEIIFKMDNKLEKYMEGKGVNLSKKRILQKIKHIYLEPNNLYSLRDYFKPESLDFLFFYGINETKFYRILIKEMLIYCKVGGRIIIQIKSNKILNFSGLIKEVILCMGDKGKIILRKKKGQVIVIKKITPLLKENDSIDKWSFGIITNGKKNEWIEKQIKAIKAQKIPSYEIIVCGTYFNRKEKNFKYIHFNKKDDLGWITKKKNIICEVAKYENLCIMHDRIILDENWYKGMEKYGNYFEVLSCKVHNNFGERCGDWMTFGNWFGKFPRIGLLNYRDWDKYGCLDGGLCILKKFVWKKEKWDERLFWNEGEDAKLSFEWYKKGIVTRFNPFSSCTTLSWRHGKLPKYGFNNKKTSEYLGDKLNLRGRLSFFVDKFTPFSSVYFSSLLSILKNDGKYTHITKKRTFNNKREGFDE